MSQELCDKLKYHFQNSELLTMALTHRSKGGEHNERLEFLGDGVVNFVAAELLYHQFPYATEGELSRWRSSLVNRDTLADLAREFDLGKYLYLGVGEIKSGGNTRHSILSCAMESIIGAIYLDAGFDVIRACLVEWYEPLIQSLSAAANHKDPKTLLQEYLQHHHLSLPCYTVQAIEGEAHQQLFVVSCQIKNPDKKSVGKGTSRRRGEQDAAQAMLKLLNYNYRNVG